MATPNLKWRPLTGKSRTEKMVSDNIRNGQPGNRSNENKSSLLKILIDVDAALTSKLGLCASPNSALGFFRPLMILLEWSCHGVPWIAGTIFAILASHDRSLLQIFLNFLIGKYIFSIPNTFQKSSLCHKIHRFSLEFESAYCI